ncbi:MAG: UDP-N-acetylmuramoyl-tripeptide--D-alanyl-D-alanine ligase [Candidatus Omnitrophica bacterium]|nr:UDP-N-acetylmuramoyl-tripeptide--D-alanyl-D-alanine ligase [Candidatus Omnitrophota bacterium]
MRFSLSLEEIIKGVNPKSILNLNNFSLKVKGVCLDSRRIKKGEAFLALKGKNYDAHNFLSPAYQKGAVLLIVERIPSNFKNKNVPILVVEDTEKALGFLGKALREKLSPAVVAITGSLGKTTTKEMLAFILEKDFSIVKNRASENNQIGVPKTLLSLKKNTQICILEFGTNHFGEIAYLTSLAKPQAGVITCIDNVHLEFFKNKRGVLKEKSSLFRVEPFALPILNGDDPYLQRLSTRRKPLYFGRSKKFAVYFSFLKKEKNYLLFKINSKYKLKLNSLGMFNIYNACGGLAGGLWRGVSLREGVERLSYFKFPPLRLEVKNIKGIKFINDAYNSNPTALKRALESFSFLKAEGKIGVIADMLELGEKSLYFHRKIAEDIYKTGFKKVIFLGKFVKFTAKALKELGFDKKDIFIAEDLDSAKQLLFKIAKKGDVVFLKGSRKFSLEKILTYN